MPHQPVVSHWVRKVNGSSKETGLYGSPEPHDAMTSREDVKGIRKQGCCQLCSVELTYGKIIPSLGLGLTCFA